MTIANIINNITAILNQVIQLIMVVATVVFLWGVVKYILASGDEKKLAEGRKYIIYGLIGLFVMIAMWGIVYAVKNSLFGGAGLYNDPESCYQARRNWNPSNQTCQ